MPDRSIFKLYVIVIFTVVCSALHSRNTTHLDAVREKRILDAIFKSGYYDKRIRPRGEDGYTTVNISLILQSGDIDEFKMEFRSDIIFEQRWNDKRLKYNNEDDTVSAIRLENGDEIWKPDLYFPNMKQGHIQDLLAPNIGLLIYSNGDIHYSSRMSVFLHCPMDLENFPFDRQICSIVIESYGFTNKDVILRWSEEKPSVVVNSDFYLPRFFMKDILRDHCDSDNSPDEYPCLRANLLLHRIFRFYWTNIFLPYIILTTVSWVSFWLDPKAIIARVLIVITTLLTMAIQNYWINASLPPFSHARTLDTWTSTCLNFVFFALMEIATVNFISRIEVSRSRKDGKKQTEELELNKLGDVLESFERKSVEEGNCTRIKNQENGCNIPEILYKFPWIIRSLSWFHSHFPSWSEKVDALSRILFPLAFFIFSLSYFGTYSSR